MDSRIQDWSIRAKLNVAILVTTIVSLLLAVAGFSVYEFSGFRERAVGDLSATADIVGANCTAAISFDNRSDARQTLSSLVSRPRIISAAVYTRDRQFFAGFNRPDARPGFPPVIGDDGWTLTPSALTVVRPIILNAQRIGSIFIESDLTAITDRYRSYAWITLMVLLVSTAGAWIVGSVLQRIISRPVLALADAARTISEKDDYSVRVPGGSRDELGELAKAFNQMLTRIQEHSQNLQRANLDLLNEIVERRRIEEDLRNLKNELEQRVQERTGALELANRELEAFSYSVSHDLKAPLRAISGYASMIAEDASQKLSPEEIRYLRLMSESASNMGMLIEHLLNFARLSRKEIARAPVNMRNLAESVMGEQQNQQPDRSVSVRYGDMPAACGDYTLIRQIWTNLISNAFKFTRERSEARLEFGSQPGTRDGMVTYFLRDNGVGFDMRYAGKLFGVFQRLHQSDEYEGTGIGLAFVKRIVERHGGMIWAEGEPGKGAIFYFSLPPG